MRWLGSITNSVDLNLCKLREIVEDWEAWRAAVRGVAKGRTRLGSCTPRPRFDYGPWSSERW